MATETRTKAECMYTRWGSITQRKLKLCSFPATWQFTIATYGTAYPERDLVTLCTRHMKMEATGHPDAPVWIHTTEVSPL